jgi:DNA gyrase subunit A
MDDDAGQGGRQIEAIVAGALFELRKAQERADILGAILLAAGRFEAVCAVIRSSDSPEALVSGLAELLGVGDAAGTAVANMQLKLLAPYRHRLMVGEYDELSAGIADLKSVLESPERQRMLIGTERGDYLVACGLRDSAAQ